MEFRLGRGSGRAAADRRAVLRGPVPARPARSTAKGRRSTAATGRSWPTWACSGCCAEAAGGRGLGVARGRARVRAARGRTWSRPAAVDRARRAARRRRGRRRRSDRRRDRGRRRSTTARAVVEHAADLDVLLVVARRRRRRATAPPISPPPRPSSRSTRSRRSAGSPASADGEVVGDADAAAELRRLGHGARPRPCSSAWPTAPWRSPAPTPSSGEQFDVPIGSFQAIKHLLADMYVRRGLAQSATYAAAAVLDDPGARRRRPRPASAAKLLAGEAAIDNAGTADPGARRHGLHLGHAPATTCSSGRGCSSTPSASADDHAAALGSTLVASP